MPPARLDDNELMLSVHALVRNGYGFADVMAMDLFDLTDWIETAVEYNRLTEQKS